MFEKDLVHSPEISLPFFAYGYMCWQTSEPSKSDRRLSTEWHEGIGTEEKQKAIGKFQGGVSEPCPTDSTAQCQCQGRCQLMGFDKKKDTLKTYECTRCLSVANEEFEGFACGHQCRTRWGSPRANDPLGWPSCVTIFILYRTKTRRNF